MMWYNKSFYRNKKILDMIDYNNEQKIIDTVCQWTDYFARKPDFIRYYVEV